MVVVLRTYHQGEDISKVYDNVEHICIENKKMSYYYLTFIGNSREVRAFPKKDDKTCLTLHASVYDHGVLVNRMEIPEHLLDSSELSLTFS